ncbi:g3506 [Coccomyxa viridis]|uniref:G3506 protein n=1 Tax=Coccomyxa viridis TaxID=1274662 RepID=A0ABP1FQV8_9CHLO
MRRTQLAKLFNNKMKQGSASNCTAQEVFSEHLRSHGMEHDSLKRCFVKQQDQAVKVHDPLVLAEYFEALIGTSGYVTSIAKTRQGLSERIKVTERRRSEISPDVRKCKAYLERESKFHTQKRRFLGQKQEHLQAETSTLQKERAKAQGSLKAAKRELDAQTLAKQAYSDEINKRTLQRSRLEVRLKSAKADTKASSAKAKRTAKRLAELTSKEDAARKHLELIEEGICSLQIEEGKQQAAVDALQISEKDESSLMALQAQSEDARAQMEVAEASKAEKQQKLAGIMESMCACKSKLEESRSSMACLKGLELENEKIKASVQAKLFGGQQAVQKKESEIEALQAEHLQAQVRCQGLRGSLADAESGKGTGRYARFDEACLRLSEMSKAGKLPGAFYGRICNIAHVSGLNAAPAVNAVAKEAINLATTFVVGNRQCAEHVLEYLRHNQVGVATCLIAEETPSSNARAALSAHSLEGLVSVGGNADLQGVFRKLFGSWRLVDSRSEAVAYMDSEGRRKHQMCNIVTRQGELFKADGEVVSSGRPAGATDKYELAAYPKAILRPPAVVLSSSSSDEAEALKQRLAEAAQQERTICRQVEEAAEAVQMLKAELARETAALEAHSRGASSRAKQRACEAAEAAYSQACCEIPGGTAYLRAQQGLHAVHLQVIQAEAQRRQAEQELKRVLSQKAAVEKAMADMDEDSNSAKDVEELAQKLRALKEQLAAAERGLAEAEEARHAKQQSVKAAQQCLDQADRKASKAELDRVTREKAVQAVQGRLAASRHALQNVEQALKTFQDGDEDTEMEEHGKEGRSSGRHRSQRRPMLVVSSESDEDDVPEEAPHLSGAKLDALEEELTAEEDRLQDMRKEVRMEVLEEEDALAVDVARKVSELAGHQDDLARLEAELGELEEQRYVRFAAAVKETNVHLSAIFRRLSGQRGDAYCSHADDTRLAFAQGLEFHVRPDNRAWRPFPALSGGQQALATLALSFALQAAYPSPLYFFDEIDCMLDATTAARVAEYIRSQARSQYIVVSHKPQVYEKAQCLIGVYTCNGSSQAVTLSCEE